MKILVTGGAGFIGSHFVRIWKKNHKSDTVTVLDKLTFSGRKENLAEALPLVEFIEGDIADASLVEDLVKQSDCVINFAAEAFVDRSISNPENFIHTNILGTFRLLEAVRKFGVRFHHVSTDEVYGHLELDTKTKWTEGSPYDPRSPYAASKASSDHLVRSYFHTYNSPVTLSNCANNLGTYMRPERLIPRAICRLLEGMTVPIYKPGNQVRQWLHVEDHVSALMLILKKGKLGETYFVGPSDIERSNLEVIKLLLKIMQEDESKIEFVGDRPGHDLKYALDSSKLQDQLGWIPKYSLEKMLKEMVDWYKENRSWWLADFQDAEAVLNNRIKI